VWRILVLIALGISLIFPCMVQASTTADVTITAFGVIIASPSGFTITYVSDYQVDLNWINPPTSVLTMVRVAYGHSPTSITDGYELYSGNGTSFSDTSISLTTPDIIYYSAWSQNGAGVWSPIYSSATTEDIMSTSFLFIIFILIGLVLFVLNCTYRKWFIGLIGMFAWILITAYCMNMGNTIGTYIGYISIFMAAINLFIPLIFAPKKENPTYVDPDDPSLWEKDPIYGKHSWLTEDTTPKKD
jgi:hypothetical protein